MSKNGLPQGGPVCLLVCSFFGSCCDSSTIITLDAHPNQQVPITFNQGLGAGLLPPSSCCGGGEGCGKVARIHLISSASLGHDNSPSDCEEEISFPSKDTGSSEGDSEQRSNHEDLLGARRDSEQRSNHADLLGARRDHCTGPDTIRLVKDRSSLKSQGCCQNVR